MKRFFLLGFFLLGLSLGASPTHAQFTLLPQAPADVDCIPILQQYELDGKIPTATDVATSQANAQLEEATNKYDALPDLCKGGGYGTSEACKDYAQVNDEKQAAEQAAQDALFEGDAPERDVLLGCAIKTGRISLQMLPYFITYMANFLLAMSGIVSVLFIVIGGYLYIYGGLVDQKERGKKYLINALVGLSLATVSWSLVTFIINAITS